jgi:hypothetical protein
LHQDKKLLHGKENERRDTTEWEKIIATYLSNRKLIPRLYKELFKM